jgi:hypothetical protein
VIIRLVSVLQDAHTEKYVGHRQCDQQQYSLDSALYLRYFAPGEVGDQLDVQHDPYPYFE